MSSSSNGSNTTCETKQLIKNGDGAGAAVAPAEATASEPGWALRWGSLALLVVQNSGLFVVTRLSRTAHGHKYLTTVAVLLAEVAKMVFCVAFLAAKSDGARDLLTQLHAEIWERRRETARLSVPALCYTLQNNLIFLALSNLSAASCQVLYQTKTITTALFSVVLLGKRFGWRQWLSFFLLAFGVVLVQSQDAKSEQAPEGNRPLVGIGAALTAAALSGFAGCYLELMFNKGATSLWMRNVQLALFTIPLQLVAVAQSDLAAVRRHGLLQGFTTLTWLVVFTQFAGGLVVAVVIKYCGNILKTMATVVAIIVTCFLSMALFDARPTALFWGGVAVVSVSIWLYSQKPSAPKPVTTAWSSLNLAAPPEPA